MRLTDKDRSQDLLDAASCRVAVAEIRDMKKTLATRYALEMLLAATVEVRQKARNNLEIRCRKALRRFGDAKGLYVPPGGFPRGLAQTTGHYISTEIDNFFAPYVALTRRAILLAALRGEFRYFPRNTRLHLISLLRKYGPYCEYSRRKKHIDSASEKEKRSTIMTFSHGVRVKFTPAQ